jgi:hypothetical protein
LKRAKQNGPNIIKDASQFGVNKLITQHIIMDDCSQHSSGSGTASTSVPEEAASVPSKPTQREGGYTLRCLRFVVLGLLSLATATIGVATFQLASADERHFQVQVRQ